MIELKKFVCVFIFTLLSDTNSDNISLQNGFLNKLGLNRTLRSPQRRLFGGQKVEDIVQFPFMVWITLKVKDNQSEVLTSNNFYCGGSIISKRFVLTAGHCAVEFHDWICGIDMCSAFKLVEAKTIRILAGGISPISSTSISEVKKVYIPKTFKITDKKHQCLFRSDMALLELKKPLHFNSKVNKLRLPKPVHLGKVDLDETKTNALANENKFCTVLGYGATSNEDRTPKSERILKFEEIQLITYKKCIGYMRISNEGMTDYKHHGLCTDTAVCSYDKKRKDGICSGDSGSPLICEGEQIGLVSWSAGGRCVLNRSPDIYTRVDVHVPWIRSVMKNCTGRKQKH